jgi:uncharacterized protein
MNLDRIDQIAREAMMGRSEHPARAPGWLYYHGRRTGRIAQWLAKQLLVGVDEDLLYVGALFHDVGKGKEPHNEIGAEIASVLLGPICTADEIAGVCELVRNHNQRNEPGRTAAVKLVQDADLLDHVGPIGPWLAFYWSGARGESIEEHRAFIRGEENRQYRAGMKAMLNFEFSRQEFDKRVRFEDEFFSIFHQVHDEGVWQELP